MLLVQRALSALISPIHHTVLGLTNKCAPIYSIHTHPTMPRVVCPSV